MPKAICSLPDCGKPQIARGWCNPHYLRWRNHGDPLAGNPTPRVAKALDNPDGTRTCLDCRTAKDLADFPRDKNATRERRSNCKPCHSARSTAWYAANKEDHLPRAQARYVRDIDKIRARDSARYHRDKPKRLALVVDVGNRRRATLRHGGEWDRGITCAALRKRDGDGCHYCGVTMTFAPATGHKYIPNKATVEHITPISKGGTHTWGNVALACWQCNVRKGRRTVEQWRGPDAAQLRVVHDLLRGPTAQLEILF